ncbi:hypothetical protein Leryth_013363 [Lithospermum erythrorhizon]|nr:hypothetical protein Leryth_013363 [Lithospermum erythrorhizon]
MASTIIQLAPIYSNGFSLSPRLTYRVNYRKAQSLRVSSDYSRFEVRELCYRAPGTDINLLNGVNISLNTKSLGLIFGRSGSGKTTLLQLIAGLSKPTSGSIYLQQYGNDGVPNQAPAPLQPERVGIVFQFPERCSFHNRILGILWRYSARGNIIWVAKTTDFRSGSVGNFAYPKSITSPHLWSAIKHCLPRGSQYLEQYLFIFEVGLTGIPLDKDPNSLSGGYKRRLAMAVQLVQTPDLLILDEPLAGLGMKAHDAPDSHIYDMPPVPRATIFIE